MTEKPGVQTTEFITTLAPWVLAVGVLILLGMGRIEPEWALTAIGLLGIGGSYASGQYSKSRGNVKAAAIEAESVGAVAIIHAENAQEMEAAKWKRQWKEQ